MTASFLTFSAFLSTFFQRFLIIAFKRQGGVMKSRCFVLVFFALSFVSCREGPIGPSSSNGPAPGDYFLYQNFPNPFTDTTWIPYGVPAGGGYVELTIYDKYFNAVQTLTRNDHAFSGTWNAVWDGRDSQYKKVPPGFYIVELYGSQPHIFISRITIVRIK